MDNTQNVLLVDGESIVLHENEEINDDTIAELTGGKEAGE